MSPPESAEIELKLLAHSSTTLSEIARRDSIGQYQLRPRPVQELQSTYLDTENFALRRNGVGLRLRRRGTLWEATAKWAGAVNGAVHSRPEINVSIPSMPIAPFTLPAGQLYDSLFSYVLGRPLRPILVTAIRRQLLDVVGPRGGVIAELALDTVRHGPTQSELSPPYYEVEVELRDGKVDDLHAVGDVLRREHDLAKTSSSKLSRGLVAVNGEHFQSVSQPESIAPTDTWESATRKVVAMQLARLRSDDRLVRSPHNSDPEPVHRMRVATRRLRSACKLLGKGMPRELRTRGSAELRWLGDALGEARDLDVQLARLGTLGEDATSSPELRHHAANLRRLRRGSQERLCEALTSQRYIKLMLLLEKVATSKTRGRLRDPVAKLPVSTAATNVFEKTYKSVRRLSDAAVDAPSVVALHKLRIRCKRLRYLLEFLSPILPKSSDDLVSSMIEFQDLLGDANDEVILARRLRAIASSAQPAAHSEQTIFEIADGLLLSAGRKQERFRFQWRQRRKATQKAFRRIRKALQRD